MDSLVAVLLALVETDRHATIDAQVQALLSAICGKSVSMEAFSAAKFTNSGTQCINANIHRFVDLVTESPAPVSDVVNTLQAVPAPQIVCDIQTLVMCTSQESDAESKDEESRELLAAPELVAWPLLSKQHAKHALQQAAAAFEATRDGAARAFETLVPTASTTWIDSAMLASTSSAHMCLSTIMSIFDNDYKECELALDRYAAFLSVRVLCLLGAFAAAIRAARGGGPGWTRLADWIVLIPSLLLHRVLHGPQAKFRMPASRPVAPCSIAALEKEVKLASSNWRMSRAACAKKSMPWLCRDHAIDIFQTFLRSLFQHTEHLRLLSENVGERGFLDMLGCVDAVLEHPQSYDALAALQECVTGDVILRQALACFGGTLSPGFHVGGACALRAVVQCYRAAVCGTEPNFFPWRALNTPVTASLLQSGNSSRIGNDVSDRKRTGRALLLSYVGYVVFLREVTDVVLSAL